MLSEVVTCNCVRNPGGHAESNPRPSEEGVSFYHVLRPLDPKVVPKVCDNRDGWLVNQRCMGFVWVHVNNWVVSPQGGFSLSLFCKYLVSQR